jgi:two-component system, sensor histidine kinase LadS
MLNYVPAFFLAVIFSLSKGLAQPYLPYHDAQQLVEVGTYARYYEDKTNQLTPQQVAALPDSLFRASTDQVLNLGFSPARVWLKFSILNQTPESLYAILEAQDIDYIDAYVVSLDTTYFLQSGVLRPFANRYFGINSIVLYLGPQPQHIFIALEDINGLVLPLKVGAIQPLVRKIYHETMINAFVVGVMILIILFSFFLYLSLRDRTYLLYALHVLFSALTLLSFEGYLSDLLWRDIPYMNNSINSSLIRLFTLLTSIAFSVAFLNLKEILPAVYRAFLGLGGVAIVILIAKLVGVQEAEMWFNVSVLATFLSFLAVGCWLYRRGFRPARFYLLGWGIYIIEILLVVLTLFNVLSFDHFYTYYGYQIGAVFQATLLTFALLDRVNTLRQEAREAQELALRRLEENDKLMAEQNRLLEKELEQKPAAPSDDLQQLLKMIREEREKVKKIPIATMEGVLLFPVADIVRVEAMGSYANVFFTNRQKLMASRSLSEFEQQLSDHENFFKVHKSHLVNLNYVAKYVRGEGGVLVMEDGSEVDVARRVKPDFMRKMGLDS